VATDLLERIRSEIDERLTQLRPLLSEYERLAAAAETLAAVGAAPLAAVGTTPRRAPDAAPRGGVDTAAETSSVEAPYAKSPYAPPARAVPELPAAQAPTPSTDAPRLPAEAPQFPLEAPADPTEEPPTPALRRAYPLRGSDGVKLAMSLRTTPLQRPTPRPTATPAAGAPSATQVLERPSPAPPVVEEDTWQLSPPAPDREPAREPASPAAVRQAIIAALEHGSHTANELVMVTAMSTPEIRGGLIRLTGRGAVTKVKRRGDGKTAYALPFSRA
jgi:hypothetical protein